MIETKIVWKQNLFSWPVNAKKPLNLVLQLLFFQLECLKIFLKKNLKNISKTKQKINGLSPQRLNIVLIN